MTAVMGDNVTALVILLAAAIVLGPSIRDELTIRRPAHAVARTVREWMRWQRAMRRHYEETHGRERDKQRRQGA